MIMLVEDLSSVEKDSPVVVYINDSEESRILVIDSTYFEKNKLIIKEFNGEKIELKDNRLTWSDGPCRIIKFNCYHLIIL